LFKNHGCTRVADATIDESVRRLSNFVFEWRLKDVLSSSDVADVNDKIDRAGDLDELFIAKYAALARLIYRVVGDTGWAEELAAEAFWKLHRNPPGSDRNLTGWLYRTGLRLALDDLKKRKRRVHYEALAAAAPGAMESPEEACARREQQARVRNVLVELKKDQAGLLLLRSEGYSLAEIAAVLALNPGSVGTFLTRAEAAFRKEYVKRYGQH
jgi:RNA polymerase sigma-70 factor (ECF subfamily)